MIDLAKKDFNIDGRIWKFDFKSWGKWCLNFVYYKTTTSRPLF